MAIGYYLACEAHGAVMRNPLTVAHTRGFDLDGRDEPARGEITQFVARHQGCSVAMIDEHEAMRYDDEQVMA